MLGLINVSALSSTVRQFIFEYTGEHDPSADAGLHEWTLTEIFADDRQDCEVCRIASYFMLSTIGLLTWHLRSFKGKPHMQLGLCSVLVQEYMFRRAASIGSQCAILYKPKDKPCPSIPCQHVHIEIALGIKTHFHSSSDYKEISVGKEGQRDEQLLSTMRSFAWCGTDHSIVYLNEEDS